MSDEIYDIRKYSDAELYNILDISNPTDRELEARIIHLIQKYTNMQNDSGNNLAVFFQQIYDHFFDGGDEDEDEDEDNDVIEPFDNMSVGKENIKPQLSNITEKPKVQETQLPIEKVNNIQSVQQLDYSKDKLQLNPLLKQTIKRIISVDSQYRNIKTNPFSTSFTFDLSEPLKDVVSLKLYSVQIPYTWYTISNSYGSNFFYLKGVTNGINNGYHDYQVGIPIGNYTPTELVTAVSKGFRDVSNNFADVNFGETGITYESASSKITLNIDIQKIYTESYYQLNFPYWTPSVNPDLSGTDLNTFRTRSIPSYLGFDYETYLPYTVNSTESYVQTAFLNNDVKSQYGFDASNNSFKIIQYLGPTAYNSYLSTVLNTFTITLYDTINNTGFPANSYSSVGEYPNPLPAPIYIYTRQQVISMINTALQKSGIVTSTSGITQVDISNNPYYFQNAGYSYLVLTIILDRNKVKYVPNSKVVVIFPNENIFSYNSVNTNVWLLKSGLYSSCLFFSNLSNELCEFVGESEQLQSSYFVDSSTNIYFSCSTPSPYVSTPDFSANDFVVKITPGFYTLNQFISQINTDIRIANNTYNVFNILNTNASLQNSYFTLNVDLKKSFTETSYSIYYDNTSILCKYMGYTPLTEYYDMSNNNVFDSSFSIIYTGYVLDTSYICTLQPNGKYGNKNDISYNICLTPDQPNYIYGNYTDFINAVERALVNFQIYNPYVGDIQLPLSQTNIDWDLNNDFTKINMSLNLKFVYNLTENFYNISFNDNGYSIDSTLNIWSIFALDASYNLLQPGAYSTITGKNQVSNNQITIFDGSNNFTINPYNDPIGGAYTPSNNITITINPGTYIITTLIDAINAQFNSNPQTYGSSMSTYNINNKDYVKLRLNVNKVYTSADYNLVFYDPYSFIKCYAGSRGLQNTTWDTTLGWILGYRDYTQYSLLLSNQVINVDLGVPYYLESFNSKYYYTDISLNGQTINSIVKLTGDTTLSTNLYNYFLISLDDYMQNHLNDGLVTITRSQTSIPVPEYAKMSNEICDPVTGELIQVPVSQINNASQISSGSLTQKQLYSLNQSIVSQKNSSKSYSAGPFIKDLFGLIPIKTSGLPNGAFYIEFGGSLQNQERVYFGPVNIFKMGIQLLNDRGDVIDLNGSNWSFSFICEQLYRNTSSSNN